MSGRLKDKPSSCLGCPAYDWGVGFVEPSGPDDTEVLVLGPGPIELEARFSESWMESTHPGRWLNRNLRAVGLQRNDVVATHLVWCWLPKTKTGGKPKGLRLPLVREVEFCTKRHLLPLMQKLDMVRENGKLVIALGTSVTKWLLGLGSRPVTPHVGTLVQRSFKDLGAASTSE